MADNDIEVDTDPEQVLDLRKEGENCEDSESELGIDLRDVANCENVLHLLFRSLAIGDLPKVKELVELSIVSVDELMDQDGDTPLMVAAHHGRTNIVQFLLSKNPNLDAVDNSGMTALHMAAHRGHLEVVKKLVNAVGVDFAIRTNSGNTPLHSAANGPAINVVKFFLSKNVDPDTVNKQGNTALHLSVKSGDLAMMVELVNAGASMTRLNDKGETLLHLAARNGHFMIVQELVNRGVSMNPKDNEGYTPLSAAIKSHGRHWIREGYTRIVLFLLAQMSCSTVAQQ